MVVTDEEWQAALEAARQRLGSFVLPRLDALLAAAD